MVLIVLKIINETRTNNEISYQHMWSIQAVQCITMFNQKKIINQTIHSRSSICSFLGLIAHIQLLIEPKKLIWLFNYFLDQVYTLILYFKPLATATDFAICHVTLFGCRPVRHFPWANVLLPIDARSWASSWLVSSLKHPRLPHVSMTDHWLATLGFIYSYMSNSAPVNVIYNYKDHNFRNIQIYWG